MTADDRQAIDRGLCHVMDGLDLAQPSALERTARPTTDVPRVTAPVASSPAPAGSRIPGWIPRFYPPGSRSPRPAGPLRRAAGRVRAEQHLLCAARRSRRSTAGAPRRRRIPVRRQGPARGGIRALYGDPATSVPWLTETAARPSASGWAPCCSAFRARSGDARTTSGSRAARRAWPALDPAGRSRPSTLMARRRDVRRAAGSRRRAVHDGPRRARGRRRRTSAAPARSCTCGCAGRRTTTRRSTPGRGGSCRSSTTASTRTCCSGTTRTARARVHAAAFAARVERVAPG